MLRYNINRSNMGNDYEEVLYSNITLSNYEHTYGENMCVTVSCENPITFKRNDVIHAAKTRVPYNPEGELSDIHTEFADYNVHMVDYGANLFTIIVPKYKKLDVEYISMDNDPELGLCLEFGFNEKHLMNDPMYTSSDNTEDSEEGDGEGEYSGVGEDAGEGGSEGGEGSGGAESGEEEEEPISTGSILYVFYDGGNYTRLDDIHVVDLYRVKWVVDETLENFDTMCEVLFPDWDGSPITSVMYGETSDIVCKRIQTMWCDSADLTDYNPALTVEHPLVCVDVPVSLTYDVRINREDNVQSSFVDEGIRNSINSTPEMEKHVYRPVVMSIGTNTGEESFDYVRKINFNLHFRSHSGDDWITENEDSWNFITYGDGSDAQTYYSYDTTTQSDQSDLLCYLGFTNNDVKYQKNKLKKSFLRLSFYDSDIPGNQTLLGYSTIFINSGELYSRYMNSINMNVYRNFNGNNLTGARVDREVDEDALAAALEAGSLDDETIEKYRLSSRISVTDPLISQNCSEGFYIYLWADNDNGILPADLYMKAEFNHAKYGRSIPMMAPYWDSDHNNPRFRTNHDIKMDWSDEETQYGPARYRKFSHIKLKYKYDKEKKKHIYYLDPERYGTNFNKVLNINLYEARVAFN